MKASFPTNHNFYCEKPLKNDSEIIKAFNAKKNQADTVKQLFNNFTLTSKSESLKQLPIYRFKPHKNQLADNEEQLILRLYSRENNSSEREYFVETGLFAGVVYHDGCQFNITCRGGDAFLHRMLRVLNDVYVDTQETSAENRKAPNAFQHIIAYLFVHSLERAATLGLPHLYQKTTQRSHKVRGNVDINAYFRNDMPFMGKLTTTFREQRAVQSITDVLFLVCEHIKKTFGVKTLQPIANLYQTLKSDYSGAYPTQATIREAKNHRVLTNPMYAAFRTTLEYAEIILNNWDLQAKKHAKQATYGYLFDISQLFEVYLEKLLKSHFTNWTVTGQAQLNVYAGRFFNRNMYPDIVMRHNETDEVIVFDAKFKQMTYDYQDLDRTDFYQIHSYMSYYGENLLIGGLLYPLSIEPEEIAPKEKTHKAYSDSLFGLGQQNSAFLVEGISLLENISEEEILENENAFLTRLATYINAKRSVKNTSLRSAEQAAQHH